MGTRRSKLLGVAMLWLLTVIAGLGILWNYSLSPGAMQAPPMRWPSTTQLKRATDRATLVILAHPHCPCTKTTIGELAILMARCPGNVSVYVLFYKASGFPDEWAKSDIWQSAKEIPGVNVLIDDLGVEARNFRASTSGQTLLFDNSGRLLFSGGITGARGHAGDNAGRDAIASFVNTGTAPHTETFVFGCALFDEN